MIMKTTSDRTTELVKELISRAAIRAAQATDHAAAANARIEAGHNPCVERGRVAHWKREAEAQTNLISILQYGIKVAEDNK
jgi:hypothetical protein